MAESGEVETVVESRQDPQPCGKPGCAADGTFSGDCPGSDDENHHCVDCGQLWWDDKGIYCDLCEDYWCPTWQSTFHFPEMEFADNDVFDEDELDPDAGICPKCWDADPQVMKAKYKVKSQKFREERQAMLKRVLENMNKKEKTVVKRHKL